jgi:hypothetical protein
MNKAMIKTAIRLLLVVVAVCAFSASAHAVTGEMGGSSLLYTFYDIRSQADGGLGLTDNYFTVTNTSTDSWVQAHVRVRTGAKSIELLDFDVLLSPTDVFAFDVYQDAGATVFASCDTKTLTDSGFTPNFDRNADGTNDCFVLDSTTFPAMLSLITTCENKTAEQALVDTRKGYVEIIGEGTIRAVTGNKALCLDLDGTADDVAVSGKLLDHTLNSQRLCNTSNGPGLCAAACGPVFNQLIGRVYYATVSTGQVVTRFDQLNAEVLQFVQPQMIFHKESYTAELTDQDCVGGDLEACYAYAAAGTTATIEGADDMNFCLYTDTVGGVGVTNKFGAGATFGPTLADVVGARDGSLGTTAVLLNTFSENFSSGYITTSGGVPIPILGGKTFADSHYFSVPAPNVFDISTRFAFIFPLQHFINEKNVIQPVAIYDMEENTTTITIDKFISPGLPTITTPGEEAALFSLAAPFAEGWIRFTTSATNETSATECDPGVACPTGTGGTSTLVRTGSTSYLPGYTGAVFSVGGNHIGVSPFQYNAPFFNSVM